MVSMVPRLSLPRSASATAKDLPVPQQVLVESERLLRAANSTFVWYLRIARAAPSFATEQVSMRVVAVPETKSSGIRQLRKPLPDSKRGQFRVA
jgi:hypothetical protein